MNISKLNFLLFVAVLFTFASCAGFEDIEIGEIEDVRFSNISGRSVEFEVSMAIDNPSAYRFRITDVDLDVYVNDDFIGNIKNVDRILIPGNSFELYTFPMQVEFSNILKGAFTMYNFFLERHAEVVIEGNIKVRSFPLYKNIPVREKTHFSMR